MDMRYDRAYHSATVTTAGAHTQMSIGAVASGRIPKLTTAPFHWRSTALAVQMARRGKIDTAVSVAVSFIGVRG